MSARKKIRGERNRSRTIYRVWLHKDVVISKNLLEEPKAGAIFGRKNLLWRKAKRGRERGRERKRERKKVDWEREAAKNRVCVRVNKGIKRVPSRENAGRGGLC